MAEDVIPHLLAKDDDAVGRRDRIGSAREILPVVDGGCTGIVARYNAHNVEVFRLRHEQHVGRFDHVLRKKIRMNMNIPRIPARLLQDPTSLEPDRHVCRRASPDLHRQAHGLVFQPLDDLQYCRTDRQIDGKFTRSEKICAARERLIGLSALQPVHHAGRCVRTMVGRSKVDARRRRLPSFIQIFHDQRPAPVLPNHQTEIPLMAIHLNGQCGVTLARQLQMEKGAERMTGGKHQVQGEPASVAFPAPAMSTRTGIFRIFSTMTGTSTVSPAIASTAGGGMSNTSTPKLRCAKRAPSRLR